MQNQEQFDKILDEALDFQDNGKSIADILALFPEYATELKDLLETKAQLEKIKPDDEMKAAFTRMLNVIPTTKEESLSQSPNNGQRSLVASLARDDSKTRTSKSQFNFIFTFMKSLSTLRLAGAALVVLAIVSLSANIYQPVLLSEPASSPAYYSGNQPSAGGSMGRDTAVMSDSLTSNKGIKAGGAAQMGSAQAGQATAESGVSAPSRVTMDEDRDSIGYAPMPPDIMPPEPGYGSPPITDNREFLKTDYNSTVKTRHVAETGTRLQTLVRGYGGRIDGASFNEKFGYVSFVVPQNQFMLFKSELTSIVGKRFIIESVSVQNMLPQKQGIEEQADQITQNLNQLTSDRDALTKKHIATLASLNRQLNYAIAELKKLETAVPIDYISPADEAARNLRIANYKNQISSLRKNIASENFSYQQELNSYNSQIKNAQNSLDNLAEQDQNLIDFVATVQGTIVVEWVSISELISLYTTNSWPWIVLALGAVLVIISYRRRHPPAATLSS